MASRSSRRQQRVTQGDAVEGNMYFSTRKTSHVESCTNGVNLRHPASLGGVPGGTEVTGSVTTVHGRVGSAGAGDFGGLFPH